MTDLAATLYSGDLFDQNGAVILPRNKRDLPPIWCFLSSGEYREAVRKLDKKIGVTPATLVQVPFDQAKWQKVTAEKYPDGLPKPFSSDPTQWLFNGHPKGSDDALQVVVARLLGYKWPRQTGSRFPDCPAITVDGLEKHTDADGIVCIPSVRGKLSASERVLETLHAAYAKSWTNAVLHDLLKAAGSKPGTTLEDWLRSHFFEQHCQMFHHRPFIWHIWDGRKDGFSCLVNYHKLNYKTLENLAYSHLGDWIKVQSADAKAGKVGSDLRLGDAQALQEKLKLILAGEPPYDIFVRWKPLAEQPIGWNPDLNDGVRMNIRPFVEADTLRKTPNIKWTKDRGKEQERDKGEYPWFWKDEDFVGDRVNNVHITNAEKRSARKGAK